MRHRPKHHRRVSFRACAAASSRQTSSLRAVVVSWVWQMGQHTWFGRKVWTRKCVPFHKCNALGHLSYTVGDAVGHDSVCRSHTVDGRLSRDRCGLGGARDWWTRWVGTRFGSWTTVRSGGSVCTCCSVCALDTVGTRRRRDSSHSMCVCVYRYSISAAQICRRLLQEKIRDVL